MTNRKTEDQLKKARISWLKLQSEMEMIMAEKERWQKLLQESVILLQNLLITKKQLQVQATTKEEDLTTLDLVKSNYNKKIVALEDMYNATIRNITLERDTFKNDFVTLQRAKRELEETLEREQNTNKNLLEKLAIVSQNTTQSINLDLYDRITKIEEKQKEDGKEHARYARSIKTNIKEVREDMKVII